MSCYAWPLMYSFHLVYMHFPALVVSAQEVSGSDERKKGGGGPNHTAELCAFCLGLGVACVATPHSFLLNSCLSTIVMLMLASINRLWNTIIFLSEMFPAPVVQNQNVFQCDRARMCCVQHAEGNVTLGVLGSRLLLSAARLMCRATWVRKRALWLGGGQGERLTELCDWSSLC